MTAREMETIGAVRVYLPTGDAQSEAKRLAPRLKTVRGARIGILDNCKEFSDLVLAGVAEVLEREHGVGEVTFWRKDYLGRPAPFVREMAAACDAVVNGVGH
ncbi:MAG TPA: hypothetical protein VNK67_15680 [Burkholderiales bacterium]|nr:hypothetical protein [Burkholderiales bacterium]